MLPGPDQLCASGPEGGFVHELVVPFIRTRSASSPPPPRPKPSRRPDGQRRFPPGSQWLYAKLYTGTSTADRVLGECIGPVVKQALASGAADRWFFIRYRDPDWHLRLRFHGEPGKLREQVEPALQAAVEPLLQEGWVWRVSFDTYEREVERYGGPEGVSLAERIFHADSDAVLAIVELLSGDQGADARWRLALRGVDLLLDDLGLDLEIKRSLLKRVRKAFGREFQADTSRLKRQLGERYRAERKSLEALLDPANDEQSPLQPGLAILRRRSEQLAPVIAELRAAEQAGRLSRPVTEVARSCMHMHINRLLRSAHRAQELVLYDFLHRLYESQAARRHR
jgi:thiopeptide-type bacteriocin biosynthesis protein